LTPKFYFSPLFDVLFNPKKPAPKNKAYPTEAAPNGALGGLSWAHQQRCPHSSGITCKRDLNAIQTPFPTRSLGVAGERCHFCSRF
jgi:hypothetical protein